MASERIAIIGAGHVGLVYAACMAELGHDVTCVDIDAARISLLQKGRLPIYERGLDELVRKHLASRRLSFTESYEDGVGDREFVFIAVSTPSTQEGAADLSAVRAAARSIAVASRHPCPIIVNKSTVPVGTGDSVDHILAGNGDRPFHVVSNPEFLREGTAVHDFFNPDRIVLGSREPAAAERVARLYDSLDAPLLVTDVKTAEMIKYASNAFLATKISFINEIAQICEAVGADASEVARGMGLDPRVGPHFLNHGLGFGGSCLPKDVRALAYMGSVFGTHPQLLLAVLQINADQRRRVLHTLRRALGTLEGARVCVLGLSFKPDTDDVRDAPAVDIIRLLTNEGAIVHGYDPEAIPKMSLVCPDAEYFDSPYEAARGCDAVILATDWEELAQLDLDELRGVMSTPIFVDGRHMFREEDLLRAGFHVPGRRADQPLVSRSVPMEVGS